MYVVSHNWMIQTYVNNSGWGDQSLHAERIEMYVQAEKRRYAYFLFNM